MISVGSGPIGCQQPEPPVRIHPEGSLHVRFEESSGYSTCLVAGTAMAANYLLGERELTVQRMRQELKEAGLDETRTGDLKQYLQEHGLHLVTLSGVMDDKPPLGLRYWVEKRGYPAICVINRSDEGPAYNHAVVVIGFSRMPEVSSADIVHYLDPSAPEPLYSVEAPLFEQIWARGEYAMMVVVEPPERKQKQN